ncbi:MAG: rhodanese-like domain-containing protein, partial [Phyllobacteriaceae bacterium]|nr:rhodanese-like domain-containing protein [Phyllobacteriaceae bacterium]
FAAELMAPTDVAAQIEAGKVALVDIRTPPEWKETGVPAPATPIDMTSANFIPELKAVIAANPDKRLAFICRTGNRSAHLAQVLEQAGLKDVIDVAGGIAGKGANKGWIGEGLPVRKL